MEYELLYLVGESKEFDLEKIKKEIEAIVTKEGGFFLNGEFLKKRKMSYDIKKEARGTYIAKRFTTPNKDEREEGALAGKDIVGSINRKLNLYENILRFIIVTADEVPAFDEKEKRKELQSKREDIKKDFSSEKKIEKKAEPKVKEEKKRKEATPEESPEAVKKEEKPSLAKTKKDKKESRDNDDDIDKKLEEILNI